MLDDSPMHICRRDLLAGAATAIGASTLFAQTRAGAKAMYGLIGKFKSAPGRRDELMQVLIDGTGTMPGCLSYIVAADSADADGIWITEVWDSEASHQASLLLPQVKEAIAKGRPMIAGFGERFTTLPIGGHGLSRG
jgi:quinol monooxygenase YgiN